MPKAERRTAAEEPLQAAWQALESGDVVAARRLAAAVAADPPSPEVAEEARDLIDRTGINWPVLGYGLFAAALILTLILLANR
jgi:hypothetical protein